ncbi:GUCD1-like isoform X1 [Chlorella sorokiniana]|uniref:GUCD1-like isoform X1 n=1 Tax=Chlorella sorokiniana TaxID=3076 RepID=A0A2P6U515_CHLSO|nr:GUCD1-like isoform X1 [Chlorella sorokiniana]|eukprot:PRW61411.1 GUCD1-like isoform X1 [Chlorella sorokiniana]
MVLRALGMRHHNMDTLQQLCPTHSIWTIDLAHLLAACGARVQMLTVTIGANQAYSGERFYAEHMPSDSSRVEALFQSAPAAGIPVHQRSLPLATLKALLLRGACLPLVLVDKITLGSAAAAQHSAEGAAQPGSWEAGQQHGAAEAGGGDVAHPGQGTAAAAAAGAAAGAAASPGPAAAAAAAGEGPPLSCPGSPVGYLGHYVVLVSYDARTDEFEYRDPSSDRARLWVPADRLEAARNSLSSPAPGGGGGSGGGGRAPSRRNARVCRVPGCLVQLERGFHWKYRVCRTHAQAHSLVLDETGEPQRFCQQCSKFHKLDDFDGDRHSCRDSLGRHQERRRLKRGRAAPSEQASKRQRSPEEGQQAKPRSQPSSGQPRGRKQEQGTNLAAQAGQAGRKGKPAGQRPRKRRSQQLDRQQAGGRSAGLTCPAQPA